MVAFPVLDALVGFPRNHLYLDTDHGAASLTTLETLADSAPL